MLANIGRIQKAPDPTPDFQVEAEEDIKSATSGTLQDLFLALAKVRRPGLQGKGVAAPGRGGTKRGEPWCCHGREKAFGLTGLGWWARS